MKGRQLWLFGFRLTGELRCKYIFLLRRIYLIYYQYSLQRALFMRKTNNGFVIDRKDGLSPLTSVRTLFCYFFV